MKRVKAVVLDDHITPYRLPLFELLASEKLETTVLFCSRRLPDREWDVPETLGFGAEILRGWILQLADRKRRRPRMISINPGLLWRLIRLDPDVVVGYAYSVPAWTAFLYSRLFGKAYISWSTDTLHTESDLDALQHFSRRIIIPNSTLCITPSLQGVDKFRAFGAERSRIRVVAQTIPQAFGRQAEEARRDRRTYSAAKGINGKIVLYVGFLTRPKGVEDLLKAFAGVARQLESARLLLVGNGALREALAAQAQELGFADRVHFAGFEQRQMLPRIYAGADLFVFPTYRDTFGVVVAEAVACGLPVVCSQYAGAAQMLVEDGSNGYIVDPRNHEQLERAMLKILTDDPLRVRMSAASQTIAGRWNVETAAASFRSALLDAVKLSNR